MREWGATHEAETSFAQDDPRDGETRTILPMPGMKSLAGILSVSFPARKYLLVTPIPYENLTRYTSTK